MRMIPWAEFFALRLTSFGLVPGCYLFAGASEVAETGRRGNGDLRCSTETANFDLSIILLEHVRKTRTFRMSLLNAFLRVSTKRRFVKVTINGAAHEVTGSCFLLETEKTRLLVDCGLFQGPKRLEKLNYTRFVGENSSLVMMNTRHQSWKIIE